MTAFCFEVSWKVTAPQDVLEYHRTAKLSITIPGQKEGQFTFPTFSTYPIYHWKSVQGKNIHVLNELIKSVLPKPLTDSSKIPVTLGRSRIVFQLLTNVQL